MIGRHSWAAALIVVALARPAVADVDLVTIPTREGVQLTVYNSEDITMVREHRLLTVKKGVNRIQFSWANTLIDPTSIDFRILDHQDKVDLVDTTFPAGRNDALQWNIQSAMAGKLPVEIRYFTSGITWTGTINLVEKIAELARRPAPGWKYADLRPSDRSEVRKRFGDAVKKANGRGMGGGAGMFGPGEGKPEEQKKVVKEGLSEYFLFTIEGREDIKDKEPKRLVALKVAEVPLECLYKLTDRDGGKRFTKFYRFKNVKLLDDEGKEKDLPAMENLGLSPLPNGTVRLFSEYQNQDLAYVGGTAIKYVPIGDRVEVNVGRDPDITIVRRLKDQSITNVVARQYKKRLDDDFVLYYDLVDYDETFVYEEEIVSGKPVDVKAELERQFDAKVVLWADDEPPKDWGSNEPGAYVDLHNVAGRKERVDQNHVKYFLDLKPGEKRLVTYKVTNKRRKVGPELNTEKKREPL